MVQQKASGGSLIGLAVIFLIIFLLFPGFAIWLLWAAIIAMIFVGIIAIVLGGNE
jgi:hypothetical protein